jgi:hypothetical protein
MATQPFTTSFNFYGRGCNVARKPHFTFKAPVLKAKAAETFGKGKGHRVT